MWKDLDILVSYSYYKINYIGSEYLQIVVVL